LEQQNDVYNLSEDTKKRAILSEDKLDNVAGGSFMQTQELFATLQILDPDATNPIAARANQNPKNAESIIADGVESILQKHFGEESYVTSNPTWNNGYIINGTSMSHEQVIKLINDRIDIKKAGWLDD
jgi:hypothetical protein